MTYRFLPTGVAVLLLLCLTAGVAITFSAETDAGKASTDGADTVLATGSFWRWYIAWRPPVISVEAFRAAGKQADAPTVVPVRIPFRDRAELIYLETELPPPEWVEADFDDSDWPRKRGPFFERFTHFQTALICLRGKFSVTNPKLVRQLALKLGYRGGARVYLNGVEVARKNLPEGEIELTTPAELYPNEAWVDSKGKFLPSLYHVSQRVKAGEQDLARRVAQRDRHLGRVELPTRLLREGRNVLAVELHRSDYHPTTLGWWKGTWIAESWIPIALLDLRLEATGGGVLPNVARPQGMQLWNVDLHAQLRVQDYGDPNEPLHPILITSARNCINSGAVVLASTEPLKNVRANVGELKRAGGNEKIPSSAIKVRYLQLGTVDRKGSSGYRKDLVFDAIFDQAPDVVLPVDQKVDVRKRQGLGLPPEPSAGALLPILVTVQVPGDAAPGDYGGSLSVSAKGMRASTVPLHLQVADWQVPDAHQFRTHVGIYHSPTSLAMQYQVPEWSERHWKLVEKSIKLLGYMGNNLVHIPVVERTQLGNEEGMVYWVKRADGSFDHDFSVFDRYISLVKKYIAEPTHIVLHVWHVGGWKTREVNQENTVTVIDKSTGKHEAMQVPVFGTPESEVFWRPVLRGLRSRLAKLGLEKSMCLGILSDGTAAPEVFQMFSRILPGVGWFRACHRQVFGKPGPLKGGAEVVCWEFVYGLSVKDPAKGVPTIWHPEGPGVAFLRADFDNLPLLGFRTLAERSLFSRTRGFGRVCLDYWNLKMGSQKRNIFNRWPHSSCAQREPTVCHLAQPGPEGPVISLRLELMREGLQEAEATIVIAEAVAKHSDKLGSDLTARCREVLFERVDAARMVHATYGAVSLFHTGWRERASRLYETAAEISKALR